MNDNGRMDIFEIFRTMARQFKLVIALVILCLAIGGFAFTQIGSSYVSTADVQILPNSNSSTENPLDKLNRNQVTVSEMLTVRLTSDSVRGEFSNEGLISDYDASVSTDPTGTTSLPGIFGEISGPRSGQVDRSLAKFVEVIDRELEDFQREIGAPQSSWYQAKVLTQDESPNLVSGSRPRSLFVLLVLSAAFIISTTLIVDGVRNGRNHYRWLSRKSKSMRKKQTITLSDSEPTNDPQEIWIKPEAKINK